GEAEAALAELKGQAGGLAADKAVARDRLDELRRQVAALEERRREADGRDAAAARAELAEAEARRDEAQQELGMAKGAVARAERSLAEAEAGESSAPAQIRALAAAGIDAVGLLDAVELDEDVRERWEAALWPYREAVVVAAGDLDAAAAALKGMPGSMIVPAGGDAARPEGDARLPRGVRCERPLGAFFAARGGEAIAAGATVSQGSLERRAGVVIVGGFAEPVTGRVARVEAARAALEAAKESLERARQATSDAAADVALAARRLAGARAAEELDEVQATMVELRERLEDIAASEARLGPRLGAAEQSLRRLQAKADTRALELDRLRGRKEAHERERDKLRRASAELADK